MKRYFYFFQDVDFNARDYYFWDWWSETEEIKVYRKNGRIDNGVSYSRNEVLRCLEERVWIEIPEAEAVLMR